MSINNKPATPLPKFIASRVWNKSKPHERYYVQNVPGNGGADWGYTTNRADAAALSNYWARRFAADCDRVGSSALLREVAEE